MRQPKPITIESKIETLYSHLISLGIRDFLFTPTFLDFCERIQHRGVFQMCFDDVVEYHRIPVRNHEEQLFHAFKKFVDSLYKINDRKTFIEILGSLLKNYAKHSSKKFDLSEVYNDLLKLAYTEAEIKRAFEGLL